MFQHQSEAVWHFLVVCFILYQTFPSGVVFPSGMFHPVSDSFCIRLILCKYPHILIIKVCINKILTTKLCSS